MSKTQIILNQVSKRIAPAWPLKNFVAVNPYVGFTDTDFSETAQKLVERGHIKMTMPLSFYLDQLNQGKISFEDLKLALKKTGRSESSVEAFLGTRVHETLEKLYKDKQNQKENNLENLIEYYNQEWEKNWKENIYQRLGSEHSYYVWNKNKRNSSDLY